MPIALGPGVPALASCARMYCFSRVLTVSQSRCSSLAKSLIVVDPNRGWRLCTICRGRIARCARDQAANECRGHLPQRCVDHRLVGAMMLEQNDEWSLN